MFVNPIVPSIKSNNSCNVGSCKPVFKRQNYAQVFDKQYNRPIRSIRVINEIYYLITHAAKFEGVFGTSFFNNYMKDKDATTILRKFKGDFIKQNPKVTAPYLEFAKKAIGQRMPLLMTKEGDVILDLVNNGKYEEDNIFRKFIESEDIIKDTFADYRPHVNLTLFDIDHPDKRHFAVGLDINRHPYYFRGDKNEPIRLMEGFYTGGGKSFTLVPKGDGIYTRTDFNSDGSELTFAQSLRDSFFSLIGTALGKII